jgi:hypothetical protein
MSERRLSRERRTQIARFANGLTADDLSGLRVNKGEVGSPSRPENCGTQSRSGGHPPADYTAVEMKVDLQLAIELDDWNSALSLYYTLRRMIGV